MASPDHTAQPAGDSHQFKRELGLLSSTMIVIGSMIGSGIFIVSADMARTLGSPGWMLLTWVITGIMTIIGALSYGELAGMMPQAGGQYVYLREAFNPLTGFLYGWTLFLVIQSGSIAAVGVAFAKFTAVFFPSLGETIVVLTLLGRPVTAAQIVAITSVLLLSAVNMRGIKEGKIVQDFFTFLKISSLLVLIVLGLFVASNASAIAANFSDMWTATWTRIGEGGLISVEPLSGLMLPAAIGVALVGSLFAADAWNNVTFTAGEVINPKRTIPLSLVIGTSVVILIYLLTNVAYLVILPMAGSPGATDVAGQGIQFAASDRVGTAAASGIFGAPAEYIMAALIMISTFGCNNGMILTAARVYYAMAKDGLFFRRAGTLNGYGVPGWALAIQALWTSLLCLSGTYSDLLDYVIFAVLIFYILTIIGLYRLRKLRPEAPRPYRAFGYPVLPALYIIAASAICVDLLIFKTSNTWPGVVIVLLGIPVYFIWKKFPPKAEAGPA